LCETAAVTAEPPASTSRTDAAAIEARMMAAEIATRVCVRRGGGGVEEGGPARG
jgi:hypothetical protein